MQRNDCRPHFLERRRRFCVTWHRPFHLVPKGPPGTIRGKFSQARELYLQARREITNFALGNRRKAVSLALARGVSSSSTFQGNESITPVPCRYDRSPGRISYRPVRKRAAENASRSGACRSSQRKDTIRAPHQNSP